jgi:queuosine biosynthesis protein QueC
MRSAALIAEKAGATIKTVKLDLPWKGSSLVDRNAQLPTGRTIAEIEGGIPSTYVPARNTVFLSMAASYAEAIGAEAIYIGAHSEDSSGYPDCRKGYIEALDRAMRLGTKAGIEGRLTLKSPLIEKTKKDIIETGQRLKVPFELTWSCYRGGSRPCMECDSCILRAKGFREAGLIDPIAPVGGRLKTHAAPAAKKELTAGITEIFSSVQGEGIFLGAKQIFVRFDGCNMNCGFCDEDKERTPHIYTPERLASAIMLMNELKGPHHSVSFTGGEPLLHREFLAELLRLLKKEEARTYLETNGTLPDALAGVIDKIDIVAMDLKLPSSTGERAFWSEHARFLKIASEKMIFVKAVVTPDTKWQDVERAMKLVKEVRKDIPFILQPATPIKRSEKNTVMTDISRFSELARKNNMENVRVIPQIHKMLNVR